MPEVTGTANQILNSPLIQVMGLVLVIVAVAIPVLAAVMWRQQNIQQKGNDVLFKVVEGRAEDRVNDVRQIAAIEELAKAQTLTLEETRHRRAQIDAMGAHMDSRFDELRELEVSHGEESHITNNRLSSLVDAFDALSLQISSNTQGSLERHAELIVKLEEVKKRLFEALSPQKEAPDEP